MENRKTFDPFLGDKTLEGILRFSLLVLLPLGILLTNIALSLIYNFSFLLGKILLVYFFGLISATATAVYYIMDIYGYEFDRIPFKYFMACFFGLITPRIRVNRKKEDLVWLEMVEKIGGPAILEVDPGFVVLTETLSAPGIIYYRGKKTFMSRRERIHEIVDLREQEGFIDSVTATTRDGIQVTVDKVKFNYRIWDSRWDGMYKDQHITRNPYPFSKQAIHDYAYKRDVKLNKEGKPELMSWEDAVQGQVKGILKGYISNCKLEEVIAPRDQGKNKHREEIEQKAYTDDFKEKLRAFGTLLRWWDPGEFKSQVAIEKQFVSDWSVKVTSDIEINKAYGNAQKMAYEELGRAEAEAELLMSIIHAMDGIKFGRDKVQTLQNLILLRTAQVIKALNTNNTKDEISKKKIKPSRLEPE